MFSLCFAQTRKETTWSPGSSISKRLVELYIPAPEDTTREASFRWHIATRNFFAFVLGKPLVGDHLGQAMIDLQERMRLFRPGRVDNHQDFLNYVDAQGYRNFVDFPDYALAMLYYAEHYKLRDAWIDAFAHCVGMNEKLVLSPEFSHRLTGVITQTSVPVPSQSRLTKALITRAYLEIEIELGRSTSAVRNFLDDDLSSAYLGLTSGARNHLDRFRSFLHSFYVDKFGYWPPPKGTTFSKALFRSLYFDFKNLYDYIVDSESTADLASQKLASGGICVLQNVDSFDKRHRFPPLPHPLPLLPSEVSSSRTRTKSQKTFKSMTLGTKQGKDERYLSARAALIMATNGESEAPVVQAYMRFERQCVISSSEEKTSMADARKVRWLLIYGTLQYLVAALRAPTEVRDTEGPNYHLCCLVTESAQWHTAMTPSSLSSTHLDANPIDKYIAELHGSPFEAGAPVTRLSTIEPDCQNCDYLQHTNTDPNSRRVSIEIPAPLKISQSSRPSSIRSRRRLSLPSLRSSQNSISLKPQTHCEILVHGYGNGLNDTLVDAPPEVPSRVPSRTSTLNAGLTKRPSQATIGPETSWLRPSTPEPKPRCCSQRPGEVGPCCIAIMDPLRSRQEKAVEWLMYPLLIDDFATSVTPHTPPKLTSSPDSTSSHWWSDGASSASSLSSTYDEQIEPKVNPAEESGLLGGLVSIVIPTLASSPVTPVRRSSLPFIFNKHPSAAETLPARTVDDHSGIGIAITAPHLSEKNVRSLATVSKASDNKLIARKTSTRISTSISRRSPSFRRIVDLPLSSTSALEKAPSSSDEDPPFVTKIKTSPRKSSKAETTQVVGDAEGTRKKERRLSFWKR
ncbi:uncharacterized protein N0V89_003084 [Didymosphaeria variabile]|uniref:DUF8004 domain-containing protein n=1 Tax=Didymosphaeria variabile TaxID=1932322 RepID=A0A9W8XVG0_9PLEO|nr:uncharacterized protein N0V89_003084 [Didymosphaeria variabile]KAJ4358500.1 hypothetical protein N0V89_003084 [Didymosphaeria variabile]